MQVLETLIPEIKILTPEKHQDARGFFSETYNRRSFLNAGIDMDFVQDNHVASPVKGTVRALHFQAEPFAQAKLVRVTSGSIFDVAVDIRKDSTTYGKHIHAIIDSKEWKQILIPVGFAHGYCTLESNTEVIYKTSNYYSPQHERGLYWNDPALNIPWPFDISEIVVSSRDEEHPTLTELGDYFTF